jgi:hypothetical protein
MPILDAFEGHELGLSSPYVHGAAVTLHDSNELATLPRALMATTTAGVVTVITIGGETIPIYLPLGICVPVRAKVVKAAGAVAAGVVALW